MTVHGGGGACARSVEGSGSCVCCCVRALIPTTTWPSQIDFSVRSTGLAVYPASAGEIAAVAFSTEHPATSCDGSYVHSTNVGT